MVLYIKLLKKTYAFTNSLHNEYVAQMEHNINLVVKLYSDIPDEQLQSIIKNKIGKYDMEFNYE